MLATSDPWDPFGHSEGQVNLNVQKSKRSLEMGSRGLPTPGGKTIRTEFKNELKGLEKICFELVFSFFLFLPCWEPMSRFFWGDFFTFRLLCPSGWPKGSQGDPEVLFCPTLSIFIDFPKISGVSSTISSVFTRF